MLLPGTSCAPTYWSGDQRARMAAEVRQEFLHAWNDYKQYAWGHDELLPLSRRPHDWYGTSLLMTPIDAMDTMTIMGLDEEAATTREYVATHLSFDKDISVQTFEVTIRLLGGLLSNYELSGDQRMLALAVDLGNRLLPSFQSPTGMPYRFVNLKTGVTSGNITNTGEIGTLMLEFGTLSKLTKNPIYYDTAKRAVVAVYGRRSAIGLVGFRIDVDTGQWIDTISSISGGTDSYYEYLLKAFLLFDDKDFDEMFKTSVAAVNHYLADVVDGELWYGQSDMNSGARASTHYGALEAFFPAVLMLSGDRTRAVELQQSSYKMWALAGVEPETIDYSTLSIMDPAYRLRPEIMESNYYLYFFTGDKKYLDMGQVYFEALKKYCRNEIAYTELKDVTTKERADAMQSYFFAETMKYLYLLYAPRTTLDLNHVVFNTEAHPLRRMW